MATSKAALKESKLKIKKFRIHPRLPSVKRILKALLNTKELPADLEANLPIEAQNFVKNVIPTAFYRTWSLEAVPPALVKVVAESKVEGWVSMSAMLATIGPYPDKKIAEWVSNGDTLNADVVNALGEETVTAAFDFLMRLLKEEAEEDDCEVNEPIFLTDPAVVQEFLTQLGADNEGVKLDETNRLIPQFTRLGMVAWIPKTRKRKNQSLPLKKKPTG